MIFKIDKCACLSSCLFKLPNGTLNLLYSPVSIHLFFIERFPILYCLKLTQNINSLLHSYSIFSTVKCYLMETSEDAQAMQKSKHTLIMYNQ